MYGITKIIQLLISRLEKICNETKQSIINNRIRHRSFSNPSFASPTSQALHVIHLILQPFRHFTYVTAHSLTLTSLSLPHDSFSDSSVASSASRLILRPFFRFSCVAGSSWVTWGADHAYDRPKSVLMYKLGPVRDARIQFCWIYS